MYCFVAFLEQAIHAWIGHSFDGEPAAIRALSWPGSRDAFGPFVSLALGGLACMAAHFDVKANAKQLYRHIKNTD
jgi:hypothetical protein